MNHLLVIRLSALGDVALLAPVVKAWAAANPAVRFTVAAPPLLEPLFEGVANIDFLGVSKKQSAVAIFRQLRDLHADAVADMHQINRVGRALTLLWLHEKLHLHLRFHIQTLHKGRLSRWLMLSHLSRRPRRPQYLRYADVFLRLGLQVPSPLPTLPSPLGRTREYAPTLPLSTLHSPLPTVGIAPFAQHRAKIWPLANTIRLATLLADKGYRVLLFGSKEEASQLENIASRHQNIQSVAGRYTFREELELIRSLSVIVTMDSSNMHFASAVGTPVISIWGATHPDFGFYGYRQDPANALCANISCQPCSAFGQRPCRFGDYRCLEAITPEAVLAKIEETANL